MQNIIYDLLIALRLRKLTIEDLRRRSKDDWMHMLSGKEMHILNPKPEDYDITDIAHGLSIECRYGNQLVVPFFVGQHCCNCATVAPAHLKYAMLMHDRTESILKDIVTPLKRQLREYCVIEDYHNKVSAITFDLDPIETEEMHFIDRKMMITEASQLCNPNLPWWEHKKYAYLGGPYDFQIKPWNRTYTKRRFLQMYEQLKPQKEITQC